MFIVDSQVHIWAADRPDRPWPKAGGKLMHGAPSFSAEDLLREMNAAGVARVVLVPPAHEGNRNDLVMEAVAAYPDRFAAMGRLALDERSSRDQLQTWMDQPGMRGMRLNICTEPGRTWLARGELDWFWPAAERAGIPLMVLATGALDKIELIARRYPGLRLALDHLALHRNADEAPFVDETTIDKVIELAAYPNISVKPTALPYFSTQSYPFIDVHRTIRRVFDAYGPRRMFWGTDLTRLPCSYTQAITLFTEELPWLSEVDKEWIMGRAICAWLDWPP